MTSARQALIIGLGAFAIIAVTSAAQAQITAEQQSAIRANCRSDFMSKCSGVQPGGKEALQCLQKNVDALSAGCKTAVSATIAAPAAATAAAPAKPAEPQAQKPAQQATVTQESPKQQPAAPAIQTAPKPAAKLEPAKPVAPKQQPPKTAAVKPEAKPAGKPEAPKQEAATAGPQQEMEDLTVREQTAFAPGAVVVAKACARSLLLHCPGQAGGGRAIACLKAYRDGGGRLGPRCNAALELQSKVAP